MAPRRRVDRPGRGGRVEEALAVEAEAPAAEAEAVAAPEVPAVNMPRAILPERPLLIPAGRHVPMSFVENADYEHPSLELLAEPPA